MGPVDEGLVELVIGEGWLGHWRGLLATGSEAVEDDGEIPLPQVAADLDGVVGDGSEHGGEHGDVGGGYVGAELPGCLGGFDESIDERADPESGLENALVAGQAAVEEFG